MHRQLTEASSVRCCGTAGHHCKCAEIALLNSKQIQMLTKIVVDIKMQNDEIIEWLLQRDQNPVPQETPEMIQPTQENEEIITLIASKKELIDFEQNLGFEDQFEDVKRKLQAKMKATATMERLHEALYLMFNRLFLVECSWSGRGVTGPKIAFRRYVNVLRLFADVGNVDGQKVDFESLENFFQKKLRNAKNSAVVSGTIKSVSRSSFSRKCKGRPKKKMN
uniref:DUF4806 domain-containing protein n=1 Tax=Anopheles coluzzii TaxID=1518534 RepID=A0ABM2AAD2_ANOCL